MNTIPLKHAALAALLIGSGLPLVAQSAIRGQAGSNQQYEQQANRPTAIPRAQSSIPMQSLRTPLDDPRGHASRELIGVDVVGRDGEKLGELHDFIIDSKSGKSVYAVVASGGVLGVGEKLRAVPLAALRPDTSSGTQRMTLDLDRSQWNQAPLFKRNQVASLSQDQRGREIFRYYGQTQPGRGSQQLSLTRDLIGRDVQSGTQTIGEVDDVVVQIPSGTAAALLDPNDEFAGTDQKYLVPLNKLTLPGPETLSTTLTRQDFSSAQASTDDTWARSPGGGNALYIWPAYAERVASSEGAQAPVEAIRQALQSDAKIARSQGIISVTASGDKVILGGTVQSEDIKDRIENRAEKAAKGWNIENQIRVAEVSE